MIKKGVYQLHGINWSALDHTSQVLYIHTYAWVGAFKKSVEIALQAEVAHLLERRVN